MKYGFLCLQRMSPLVQWCTFPSLCNFKEGLGSEVFAWLPFVSFWHQVQPVPYWTSSYCCLWMRYPGRSDPLKVYLSLNRNEPKWRKTLFGSDAGNKIIRQRVWLLKVKFKINRPALNQLGGYSYPWFLFWGSVTLFLFLTACPNVHVWRHQRASSILNYKFWEFLHSHGCEVRLELCIIFLLSNNSTFVTRIFTCWKIP